MGLDYMVNFNAPKECIEGSRIPKKLFYEEYDMSSSDKELFTKAIDKIVLEYMFSEDRINIAAYKNIIHHNQGNLSQKGNHGLISKNQCTIPY